MRASLPTRFAAKIRHADNGCIEWVGRRDYRGYGTVFLDKKHRRAHRVAWLLAGRDLPVGMNVLHKCDNRCCVNTDHLFIGTQADNVRDMDSKNRRASLPGALNPKARLTWEQVRDIRSMKGSVSGVELAKRYGVARCTIYNIQSGAKWPTPETALIQRRKGTATLTPDQVREVRSLHGTMSQSEIGKRFGVKQQAISCILRGKTWKSIKEGTDGE